MTVAEQIAKRSLQQGMQQGIHQVAKSMLRDNKPAEEVCRYTGLSLEVVAQIRDEIKG